MTENSETLGLATILKDLEETISSASRVPLSGKVMRARLLQSENA